MAIDARVLDRSVWIATIVTTLWWPVFAEATPPSTPAASQRDDVAAILQMLSTDTIPKQVLLGQNAGHSNADAEAGYYKYVVQWQRKTGQWPAILGVDYGWDEIPPFLQSSNRLLRRYYTNGGLVTVSMHPNNPWNRGGVHDTDIGSLRDLLDPSTRAHRRWRTDLDRVAKGLAQLRDDHVVVLWRPLHEMNGGWFWWCPNQDGQWPDPDDFVAVWRDMFEYFTHEKGLDNLIWVYSAAVQKSRQEASAVKYYPGDDYVDVVGLDWYIDGIDELNRFDSYRQLVALNKPLGLTEFGPATQRDGTYDGEQLIEICERYPKIGFAVFWHSWPDNCVALIDQHHARSVVTHPGFASRSDLTEMRTHSANMRLKSSGHDSTKP